jgi:RNA polymerase sigma factor FliA
VNARLEHELRRAPSDVEMAEALEMSVENFQESLTQISNSSVIALDELWTLPDASGDQVLLDTIHDPDAPDPARVLDSSEMRNQVSDEIARLHEREKLVVALYYYENLTLREIGEVLGVTESRVSQLHTKAILRLKSRLGDEALGEVV